MDYETVLNQALDLLADDDGRKAERILQSLIDNVKGRIDGTQEDIGRYYFWGRALTAMDEPEQALLKFEKVLSLDSSHEPALWETASIFLHELEKPESARTLLAEKLLPLDPKNALYQESLRAAEFAIKLKHSPPSGGSTKAEDRIAKPKSAATASDREKALKEEADALLRESGMWDQDDDKI